jgi:hypothetical protein
MVNLILLADARDGRDPENCLPYRSTSLVIEYLDRRDGEQWNMIAIGKHRPFHRDRSRSGREPAKDGHKLNHNCQPLVSPPSARVTDGRLEVLNTVVTRGWPSSVAGRPGRTFHVSPLVPASDQEAGQGGSECHPTDHRQRAVVRGRKGKARAEERGRKYEAS